MERVSNLPNVNVTGNFSGSNVVDTSFVLFFLGIEVGGGIMSFSLDTFLFAIVMIALASLPYFLLDDDEISFSRWMLGRTAIIAFAMLIGAFFYQGIGTIFPEILKFLPFTLLILTAMVSCYLQLKRFVSEFRIAE
ncbi:MAG: hypothetical protein ACK5NT_15805 [Pyrinomonadaceae bacterium]